MDKNINNKIAIFWDKRFENNNFRNTEIDINLSPFLELSKINWFETTISSDLLDEKTDKKDYTILCFLNFSIFSLYQYILLFFRHPQNKKYLFLFEPKVVSPLSYFKIFHVFFSRVYTWNENLLWKSKYKKIIWPLHFHWDERKISFSKKKLMVLINGNKSSFITKELYSEREKIIRYMEKNSIAFDLYGTRWNRPNLKQKIFWYAPYPSYKWRVDDKLETLSQYKFNICFENMRDTPWYITEKIWDSFMAKSVPIYWGASNISSYVPENCYIDYRDFKWDYWKLLSFISKMSETDYNHYINNIEQFLKTHEAQKWFDEKWASNFIKNIT